MKPATDEMSREVMVDKHVELLDLLAARREEFVDFLRRRARAGVEPEDLLQHALLLATRKIGQLREPDRVVAWFYRILRRLVADDHARSAARKDALPDLEAEVNASTREREEAATCACSLALIDSLPAQYAEILRRVDIAEEDFTDVAAALGTTTNNVAVRLHRARRALRQRLLAVCGTTSAKTCLDCSCGEGPGSKTPS